MPPPSPTTLPFAIVKPEMIVVNVMFAPVTVMTRWLGSALRIVVALPAPPNVTALLSVTLVTYVPALMKMLVQPVVESEFEKLVDKYVTNLIKQFGGEVG